MSANPHNLKNLVLTKIKKDGTEYSVIRIDGLGRLASWDSCCTKGSREVGLLLESNCGVFIFNRDAVGLRTFGARSFASQRSLNSGEISRLDQTPPCGEPSYWFLCCKYRNHDDQDYRRVWHSVTVASTEEYNQFHRCWRKRPPKWQDAPCKLFDIWPTYLPLRVKYEQILST